MRAPFKRLIVVFVFAMAMAWVESAAVLYLRVPIGRVIPYQTDPLPLSVDLGSSWSGRRQPW
jgi:hypothetical protein